MPVVGCRLIRKCHRPVRRQQIGIEQNAWFGAFAVLHVEDALILQPGVLEKEIAAALLEGSGKTSVVPELGQLVLYRRSFRNGREEGFGNFVLGFNPRLGLWGIGVLEPAIWIGDADAVVDIDLGAARGCGITDWRILRLGTRGAGDESE